MKNKLYMKEFEYFEGENFVTFNIVDMKDEKGLYYEYGRTYARININDFEEVE